MKIGFDAKRAFTNASGLGNYSRSLIKALAALPQGDELHLYSPRDKGGEFSDWCKTHPGVIVHTPGSLIDRRLKARWRSYVITRLLQKEEISIYHGLSNELPFNIQRFKGKKVVTVHDLIFIRHPELYPFLDRTIYNKKCRHACHTADVVVAVSEQTKKDLEELYFLPETRIRVIYQSGDEAFHRPVASADTENVLKKYGLPRDYILHVGTIEDRKNLITVVRAMERVKDIPLVVVGKKKGAFRKVSERIREAGLTRRVFFLEDVAQQELPAIYSGASVFVYPSLIEGFGIPIIEALGAGIPVIASRGGCFPEAGGPGSCYVDPLNAEELAAAISEIAESAVRRNQMRTEGLEYVKRFRPEMAAAQMTRLYHTL
ncbi:MAG: glycosyltransferase family 4 protein [Bacteroidia bacterium]|nr:glycosyltransferase family 4 protein [Bacteroidia bacterium]